MRTVGLFLLGLAIPLALAGIVWALWPAPASPPPPAPWPDLPRSVVFGPPDSPTGGELVVGILVPSPPSARLIDLVPPATYAKFLAEEEAGGRPADPAPPSEVVDSVHATDLWDDSARGGHSASARDDALALVARAVTDSTKVRVAFHDLLASECSGLPLVVVAGSADHEGDRAALVALERSGSRVLRLPGALDDRAVPQPALVSACLDAIRGSSLVRRMPEDPLEVLEARREGDDVIVRLRAAPDGATLRDLADRAVATVAASGGSTLRLPCPDPGLDPYAHRLVARLGDLRRAWRVVDLVGTAERRVRASDRAEAGASYAPHVLFTNTLTGAPVPGRHERVAIRRGDATLVEARGRSDAAGVLGVALAVPEDAPPGPAELVVGDDAFAIEIRSGLRVSVVTDRALYRPSDDVHVRVMVHRAGSGKPVAGAEVALRLRDAEKRVTTSEHGIASARFLLVEARPGYVEVEAEVSGASASASLDVRAFETPSFLVTYEPASVRLREGETAPLVVVARYVNGEPVVGAQVRVRGGDGVGPTERAGTTDERGRFEFSVRAARYDVVVEDADGRSVAARAPVIPLPETDEAEATSEPEEPTSDVLAAPPGRVAVVPDRRTYRVGESIEASVAGPDGPACVELVRDGIPLRSLSVLLAGGRATLSVPLGPDLAGLLDLRAWRLAEEKSVGSGVRVLVARGRSLEVRARAERDEHRPADTAAVAVEVTDRRGKPTAAVLGYWGVDEALLALAPWRPGREEVFDALPVSPREAVADLADAAEHSREIRFVSARDALGAPAPFDDLRLDLEIRRRSAPARDEAISKACSDSFAASVGEMRSAFLEAFEGVPLENLRTASSLQENLRRLVDEGRLDAARLRDPWGTPVTLGPVLRSWWWWRDRSHLRGDRSDWRRYERGHGTECRSAGPDLAFGTPDDIWEVWESHGEADVGGRIRRFLSFLRRHQLLIDRRFLGASFWGPATNGLIGIGGGAGGALRGHGGGSCSGEAAGGGSFTLDPVHVRRDFSPTLCFVPEAIVGPDGKARLEIPLKDSITTWRLRLVASAGDGATGIGETRIRVTQPLHAEPWIATHLTVGDDLEVPVAVRNETDDAMRVALSLHSSPQIEAVGSKGADVAVDPHGTGAHVFRIRAVAPGSARVRIDARSAGHADALHSDALRSDALCSDAVERVVSVRRLGREVVETAHGSLSKDLPWSAAFPPPPADLPTEQRLTLYPSPLADVLGGFEGLIAQPHGCFEQTSSTLHPMVLALEYLKRTRQDRPEVAARARENVEAGHQRLLGYEVGEEPGGFSLWGRAPANLFLTAYALTEFHEIAKVHPVDPALLGRIVGWLRSKQRADGSWDVDGVERPAHDTGERRSFDLTAYVAWGMARAGCPSPTARAFLEAHAAEAASPYGMALAALALLTENPKSATGRALVGRLVETRARDERGVLWVPEGETGIGARGDSAAIETTALAIQALLVDGRRADVAASALDRLVAWRGPDGRFGTTQSTILALQALLAADPGSGPRSDADVVVAGGAGPSRTVRVAAASTEPVRLDLGPAAPRPLSVTSSGSGRTRAALSRTTWLPWERENPARGRVALAVAWPQETLRAGRPAQATVTVRNPSADATASVVTIEVGIPPGCDVEPSDVRGTGAEHVERAETSVVIYLRDLPPGAARTFTVGFRPRYALDVVTAPSKAYEYYVPEEGVDVAPARIRAVR